VVIDTLFSNDELIGLGITPSGESFDGVTVAIIQNEDPSHKILLSNLSLFPNLELIFDGRNLFNNEANVGSVRVITI
jgi:hypothetical protein